MLRAAAAAALVCSVAWAGPKRDLLLLAVPNDDPDRGIYRACELKLRDRAEVQNVSVQYRELHEPGPLPVGELDRAAPAWWPKALAWDWEAGTAACRTRAAPPYGKDNKDARACGGRLAEALWQRWLEQQKADLLLQVVLEPYSADDPTDDRQRLRLTAYRPGEPSQKTAERREVIDDEVREVASVLALRLATGGGTPGPRAILRALPAALKPADEPIPTLPPVAVPRGCGPLPSKLELTPPDARFAQVLSSLWDATVRDLPAKAGPLSCAVDSEARPQVLVRTQVVVGSATLECGKTKVISKLTKATEPTLEKAMALELVGRLVEARCSGGAQ